MQLPKIVARASDEYKQHIDKLAKAVKEEAKWNWEKKLVEMNSEKWKTETISQMKEYKNYGTKSKIKDTPLYSYDKYECWWEDHASAE